MPTYAETTAPRSFAELLTSPAYPTWAKPEPADKPTRHRKTYTLLRSIANTWDNLVDGFKSAAYDHGSQTASADALDYLGENYGGLARALRDSDASYRAYLRNPLTRWSRFGTRAGNGVVALADPGFRRAGLDHHVDAPAIGGDTRAG